MEKANEFGSSSDGVKRHGSCCALGVGSRSFISSWPRLCDLQRGNVRTTASTANFEFGSPTTQGGKLTGLEQRSRHQVRYFPN